MKDSIVDAQGRSVSFAVGKDGTVGMANIDGVQKISSGTEMNTGAEVSAMVKGYNLVNQDNQVSLNSMGHIQGSKEARESFGNFLKDKQYTDAQIKGILGEAGAAINSFVPEEYEDTAKEVLLGTVGAVAGKKLIYNPARDYLKSPNSEMMQNNSQQGKGSNSKKSNPERHVNSPKENIDFAKSEIEASRENINNYNKEIDKNNAKSASIRDNIEKLQKDPVKNAKKIEALEGELETNHKERKGLESKIANENVNIEQNKKYASHQMEQEKAAKKGFFGKRTEAFGKAMSGGSSFKMKMGLATSAILLGEASATAGELMEAADPMSFFTGTEMSKESDLDYAMKNGLVASSNQVLPVIPLSGLQTSRTTAPEHAQNAFSTPSGFNTMRAMNEAQPTPA